VKAEEPKLLRVSRAAHELGLHPLTVRKWIKAGKITAIRVGNEARIPRSEIERLVGKTDRRLLVLYGRVSGHGQQDDLDSQMQGLQAWAATERKQQFALVLPLLQQGMIQAKTETKRAEPERIARLSSRRSSICAKQIPMGAMRSSCKV
jgi:putative resolvase